MNMGLHRGSGGTGVPLGEFFDNGPMLSLNLFRWPAVDWEIARKRLEFRPMRESCGVLRLPTPRTFRRQQSNLVGERTTEITGIRGSYVFPFIWEHQS
jgi:hypothetical protein